ncbi:enoyl-CoA hydratase/isomerase family protein [Roseovarius phycicola]|uniref:Enoyl-CoA hydratase/isomerase family protein n=1 Tax=Roseovarius phycicola TaxID=3080976 RepID=A0ABZ2HEW2_9RHOB
MIDINKSDDGLWQVKINRPDKANSLTRDMLYDLADIAEAAQDARTLVLTGEGKVFSAGMDLDAAKTGLATDPVWERLSGAIAALPGLSIAALNGTVAGGAIGMVLACDLRVAVPGTKIFYPVMRLGFLPQPSDPGRLRNLIGPSRAKMILMAGQKIEAQQALHWGLFDQVVEKDALLDTACDLASDTLTATAKHAAAIKALCTR